MNHIYRSIWNRTQGAVVVTSELAKNHSRNSSAAVACGSGCQSFVIKALSLGVLLGFCPALYALPTSGVVTAGSASISSSGASILTITQTSQNAALNWQSFNIGATESVSFVQPNANAIALNRVIGSDPSRIFGNLTANGKVFLVNPNGILFGKDASVNVGGLVASTLNLTDADFMAGQYRFDGTGLGSVRNLGTIRAENNGYVALVAAQVENTGTIAADGGTVALAAGGAITLGLAGDGLLHVKVDQATVNALVSNGGLIQADGGAVLISAQARDALLSSVVNNTGIVQANSVGYRNGRIVLDGGDSGVVNIGGELRASGQVAAATGGTIVASGDKLLINDGAVLDATGAAGGGTILVGGGWQGNDPTIRQASGVYIAPSATLDASARQNGVGGTVVAWSDVNNPQSSTRVYGSLRARGGAEGGDGGRIETSGHWVDVTGLRADAGATRGSSGHWLLDPEDLTVGALATDAAVLPGAPYFFTSGAGTPNVLNTDIQTQLNLGTSVVLQTAPTGAGNGDITIGANIAKTAGPDAALILNAHRDIVMNAGNTITSTSGQLAVSFSSSRNIVFGVGSNITSNGGDIDLVANSITSMPALVGTGPAVLTVATLPGANSIGLGAGAGALSLPSNFATGFSVINVFGDSGNVNIGGAVSFTDSFNIVTSGDILVNAAGSITTSKVGGVLALSSANFVNSAGAAAVSASGGAGARWIVYSNDPSTNTFGGLNSGQQGIWGQDFFTLPPGAAAPGDRYVFATPGAVTATTSGAPAKTYGQTVSVAGNLGYSGLPLTSAATFGNVYQDLLITDVLATLPTASSAGEGAFAGVTGSPYAVTASGGVPNPGYTIGYANSGTLSVNPAQLTVTANSQSRLYGAANPQFSETISGFVNGENTGVISGIPTGVSAANASSPVGSSVITSSAAGLSAANYTFTTLGNGLLTITKAPLTVTADSQTRVYGAANPQFSETISGFVNGETIAVVSGTATGTSAATASTAAGTAVITASAAGLSAANYDFSALVNGVLTITKAPLTTTTAGLLGSVSKVYDGNALATLIPGNFSFTGWLGGDGAAITKTTGTYDNANAGTNKSVSVNLSSADFAAQGSTNLNNYDLPVVVSGNVGVINKAHLTVLANTQTRLYGSPNPLFSETISGFVNGETIAVVSGTATGTSAATASTAVGNSVITASAAGLSATNYDFPTLVDGVLTINKAPLTVTANDASRLYGAGNATLGATITGFVNGETSTTAGGFGGSPSVTTLATPTTGVGTVTITPGVGTLTSTNYNFPTFVNGVLTINKAPLTVTADPQTRVYGGVNPMFSETISGFVNGETIAVVSGTPIGVSAATVNTGAGTSVITASAAGLSAANYDFFTLTNGVLTITKAPINISLMGSVSKDYDGKTLAAVSPGNFQLSGWVGSEGAAITKATGTYDNANAGDNKGVTVDLNAADYAPQGATNLNNYTLPIVVSGNVGAINKVALEITAKPDRKTYDGKAFAGGNGVSYSGFVGGESALVLEGTLLFSGTSQGAVNVGNYVILPSGITSNNYSLRYTGGSLDILPKELTVTGLLANSKEFDGTSIATMRNWGGVATGVGTETLVLNHGDANFSDPTVGFGRTVIVDGYNLANGNNAGLANNYRLTSSSASTTADIVVAGLAQATVSMQASLNGLASSDSLTSWRESAGLVPSPTRLDALPQTEAPALAPGDQPPEGAAPSQRSGEDTNALSPQTQTQTQAQARSQATLATGPGGAPANANSLSPARGPTTSPAQPGPSTPAAQNAVPPGTTLLSPGGLVNGLPLGKPTSDAATAGAAQNGTTGSSRSGSPGASSGGASAASRSSTARAQLKVFLKGSANAVSVGATNTGAVVLATFSGSGNRLSMSVTVPDSGGFEIAIPSDSFGNTAGQGSAPSLKASSSSGGPLPPWITFDPNNLTLSVTSIPPGSLPLAIKVSTPSGKTLEVTFQ